MANNSNNKEVNGIDSSLSSLSLRDSRSPMTPQRSTYVPPQLRSRPAGSSAPSSSSSGAYQGGYQGGYRRSEGSYNGGGGGYNTRQSNRGPAKDPSDEFYSRPDVTGRDPRAEAAMFSSQHNSGINFAKYDDIPVDTSGREVPEPIVSFKDSDMDPLVKFNISLSGYDHATPVQRYSVGIVTKGRDLMACAQTGSGKVCIFFFLIHARKKKKKYPYPVLNRPLPSFCQFSRKALKMGLPSRLLAQGTVQVGLAKRSCPLPSF